MSPPHLGQTDQSGFTFERSDELNGGRRSSWGGVLGECVALLCVLGGLCHRPGGCEQLVEAARSVATEQGCARGWEEQWAGPMAGRVPPGKRL